MALDRDKVFIVGVLASVCFAYFRNARHPAGPLPPGPKKIPLLGNLLDLPTSYEWLTYARWSKEYDSDIIHVSAAGIDIVVVNSIFIANELFEKRSSIYSSRPQSIMINELMGWGWLLPGMVYGEQWRERRRLFTKYFNPNNPLAHLPAQKEFIHKMLLRLLEEPKEFLAITRNTIGGLALSLAYGLPIQKYNDPYIELAEEGIRTMTAAATPGAFLVDIFSWLKYIPRWMPGAGFKRKADGWHQLQEKFRNLPYKATIQNISDGNATPSFTSNCLDELSGKTDKAHQEEVIKDTAGIVFAAGSDTTLSSVQSMFLALVNYPDVQRKAQEEIDHVLNGRLPDSNDEPDLPYVSAVVKELLRWNPVTPMGLPHFTTEDDIYEGYRIPKDTVVFGNSWAILHDEQVYPNPSIFNPERFINKDGKLDPNVLDPSVAAFGFGRRKCPGSHIAQSVLWLAVATVLSTFHISKALDSEGTPIDAAVEYQSGMLSHPKTFKCAIKPRSSAAEALIRSITDSY